MKKYIISAIIAAILLIIFLIFIFRPFPVFLVNNCEQRSDCRLVKTIDDEYISVNRAFYDFLFKYHGSKGIMVCMSGAGEPTAVCESRKCVVGKTTGPNFEVPATRLEPLIINRQINLKLNEPNIEYVGFYCISESKCINAKPYLGSCMSETGEWINITFITVQTDVNADDWVGFRTIFKPETPGQFICTIHIDNAKNPGQDWAQSKQIFITVE